MARRWRRRIGVWSGSAELVRLPEEDKISFDTPSVFLAKHKKVCIADKTVLVRCQGGKVHKIRMRFPGSITLLNHTDKKSEKMLMRLGGDKPECLAFLEEWKVKPKEVAFNRPLVKKFLAARYEWNSLRAKERNKYSDWLKDYSLADRLWARVVEMKQRIADKLHTMDRNFYSYNSQDLPESPFKAELSFKPKRVSPNQKEEG